MGKFNKSQYSNLKKYRLNPDKNTRDSLKNKFVCRPKLKKSAEPYLVSKYLRANCLIGSISDVSGISHAMLGKQFLVITGSVLAALIRVMHQPRSRGSLVQCHLKRIYCKLTVHPG
jgi:hypothetical protein